MSQTNYREQQFSEKVKDYELNDYIDLIKNIRKSKINNIHVKNS